MPNLLCTGVQITIEQNSDACAPAHVACPQGCVRSTMFTPETADTGELPADAGGERRRELTVLAPVVRLLRGHVCCDG